MRWLTRVLALALVLAAGAGAAQQAPAKLALVIGNADYNLDGVVDGSRAGVEKSGADGFAQDLPNAEHDAIDVRDALTQLGYDVDFLQNADLTRLQAGLRRLLDRATAAPDAKIVVYYAGHGVKVDGFPYIIPVGVRTPSALPGYSRVIRAEPDRQVQAAMRAVALSVGDLLSGLPASSGEGFSLVMIDSCGNNPWYKFDAAHWSISDIYHGFMEDTFRDVPMAAGVVATFSAGSGAAGDGLGRNSPFVTALKVHIGDPTLPVGALVAVTVAELARLTEGKQEPAVLQGGRKGPQNIVDVGRRCVAVCSGP